jgi:hypothetical protein
MCRFCEEVSARARACPPCDAILLRLAGDSARLRALPPTLPPSAPSFCAHTFVPRLLPLVLPERASAPLIPMVHRPFKVWPDQSEQPERNLSGFP